MNRIFKTLIGSLFLMAGSNWGPCSAQETSASVSVVITQTETTNTKGAATKVRDASNVALWFIPLDRAATTASRVSSSEKPPSLVQRNKTFEPHVLIVQVGTRVVFPNKDPFFHNIFSLYDGKRFDLGLYEAGTERTVLFDRSGISFLFCNIHAEMSAVVLSVDTPYFGISDRSGNVTIPDIPDGRYQMNIWYERSPREQLKGLTRIVTISDSTRNLGTIHLLESPNFKNDHKNKYGLDYVPPPNPNYDRP